jgi:diguanylate cyclase (GGDEF)-like protein
MPLDGPLRLLLEEVLYRRKFPPRDEITRLQGEFALKGHGRSGALIEAISQLCAEAAAGALEEYADGVIAKGTGLGVADHDELLRILAAARDGLFDTARAVAVDAVKSFADPQLAAEIVDACRARVREHLARKVVLLRLETGPSTVVEEKEREQKFGILLSPRQAERDFADALTEARRWGNRVAVFFVDLDHFKYLNDRWAHATVDETLLPAAQRLLAKLVRGRGEAYRHGGEEFLLIMPNMDATEAAAFAEKLRAAFEREAFQVGGTTQPITVSVGVALSPDHGNTYSDVLHAANRAEMEAKKLRNAVRVARLEP